MPHLAKASLPLAASPSASAGPCTASNAKALSPISWKLLISILLKSSVRDLQRSVWTMAQRSPLVLLLFGDFSRTPQALKSRDLRHRNSESARQLPCQPAQLPFAGQGFLPASP